MRYIPEAEEQRLHEPCVECDQRRFQERLTIQIEDLHMSHNGGAFVLESRSRLEGMVSVHTVKSRIVGP